MCASYAAPSESVSIRSIVAPGTLARTAALTLSAVAPDSGVSAGCPARSPGPPGPPGGPKCPCSGRVSTAVTWNALSTLTSTSVPSGLRTCASYADPSPSVSTRSTVPPGTAVSAAALTLSAVAPDSGVSRGRSPWWRPWSPGMPGAPGRSVGGAGDWEGADDGALDAAFAMTGPPIAAATAAAAANPMRACLVVRDICGPDLVRLAVEAHDARAGSVVHD